MPFDVFISYSSHDREAADRVCVALESRMISCWIAPRNIAPGASWGGSIIEAINGARIMVVVFSENTNRSDHVLSEVERAINKGLVVVPFRIQDVTPEGGLELFLSSRHWLDAFADEDGGHRLLVETVTRVLGVSTEEVKGHKTESEEPEEVPREAWVSHEPSMPVIDLTPTPAPTPTPTAPPRVETVLYPPPPSMAEAATPVDSAPAPSSGYGPLLAIFWMGPLLEFFRMWTTEQHDYLWNAWLYLGLAIYLFPSMRRVSPAAVPVAYYLIRILVIATGCASTNPYVHEDGFGTYPYGYTAIGVLLAMGMIGLGLAAPRARERINRVLESPVTCTACALIAFQWALMSVEARTQVPVGATAGAMVVLALVTAAIWTRMRETWKLSAVDVWVVGMMCVSVGESSWREGILGPYVHAVVLLVPYAIAVVVRRLRYLDMA